MLGRHVAAATVLGLLAILVGWAAGLSFWAIFGFFCLGEAVGLLGSVIVQLLRERRGIKPP